MITTFVSNFSIIFIAVLFTLMVHIPADAIHKFLKQDAHNHISAKSRFDAFAADVVAIFGVFQTVYSLLANDSHIGVSAIGFFIISLYLFVNLMRTKEIQNALVA